MGTHLESYGEDRKSAFEALLNIGRLMFEKFPSFKFSAIFAMTSKGTGGLIDQPLVQPSAKCIDMLAQHIEGIIKPIHVPPKWVALYNSLGEIRGHTNILQWSEFSSIASANGIGSGGASSTCSQHEKENFEMELLSCANFLADSGMIIHFRSGHLIHTGITQSLSDIVVLRHEFILEIVKTVVNNCDSSSWEDNAVLKMTDLHNVFNEKLFGDKSMHETLLQLLLSFEVAYKLNNQRVLIPLRLPAAPIAAPVLSFTPVSIAGRVYKFEFIPVVFFPRLQIRIMGIPQLEEVKASKSHLSASLLCGTAKHVALITLDKESKCLVVQVWISELPRGLDVATAQTSNNMLKSTATLLTPASSSVPLITQIVCVINCFLSMCNSAMKKAAVEWVACPGCLMTGTNLLHHSHSTTTSLNPIMESIFNPTDYSTHLFSLRECVDAICSSGSLHCKFGHTGTVSAAAPDIAMESLPIIDPKEVTLFTNFKETENLTSEKITCGLDDAPIASISPVSIQSESPASTFPPTFSLTADSVLSASSGKRKEISSVSGSFGKVMRAVYKGKMIAVKIPHISSGNSSDLGEFLHEARVMSSLKKNENIVRFYGVSLLPISMYMEFVRPTIPEGLHLFLGVTSLTRPDLSHLYGKVLRRISHKIEEMVKRATIPSSPLPYSDSEILSMKREMMEVVLPMSLRKKILLDAAKGLFHLHSQKPPLKHSDLHPGNVFICSLNQEAGPWAKIADFGLADIQVSAGMQECLLRDLPIQLWAPETCRMQPQSDLGTDVWNFGTLCRGIVDPFTEPYDHLRRSGTYCKLIAHTERYEMKRDAVKSAIAAGHVQPQPPAPTPEQPATSASTGSSTTTPGNEQESIRQARADLLSKQAYELLHSPETAEWHCTGQAWECPPWALENFVITSGNIYERLWVPKRQGIRGPSSLEDQLVVVGRTLVFGATADDVQEHPECCDERRNPIIERQKQYSGP
ncbi:hypothetical protein Pelo_4363 [Pelomyxa schiedti]|nr:hypothetical protein Pelo_4363 [Pelomyxa schiedti]